LRDPDQQFSARFMLVVGILIGVAVGQVALADSEELAAIQAAPISTPEAVAAPLTGPQVYNAVCIAWCTATTGTCRCHRPNHLDDQAVEKAEQVIAIAILGKNYRHAASQPQ
jgi:hypothetical protein